VKPVPLDLATLAALYRPSDATALRAAIVDMQQRGMSAHTIAQACGIAVEQVRQLLAWEAA